MSIYIQKQTLGQKCNFISIFKELKKVITEKSILIFYKQKFQVFPGVIFKKLMFSRYFQVAKIFPGISRISRWSGHPGISKNSA